MLSRQNLNLNLKLSGTSTAQFNLLCLTMLHPPASRWKRQR